MRKANAARISNRFLHGKSGKHRHDHLHGYAHKGTGGPCQAGDEEVLLPRGVGAPQHRQTHARAGAQARHKAGKAESALHVELGQQNAGRTVGNEAHQRGEDRLEEAHLAEEIGEDILAHALDDEAEEDAEQEDEGEDLQRMPQSRLPDGALVALLVVVGLVAVDLVGIAGIAAAMA